MLDFFFTFNLLCKVTTVLYGVKYGRVLETVGIFLSL